MDYKNTIHLPQTDFPMKADLPKKEPDFLAHWESTNIYSKLLEQNKEKPSYILHDGPPYANGHIHFGHILNKVLKDIIVKQKNMNGAYAPFVPGWDCHGLPIELGAMKELAESEKDPEKLRNPIVRREACRQYAHRFINAQKEEFKRLGIFADWTHPYLTLTNEYEADIAREFVRLYTSGAIYQGKKPVHWCPSCQTALAEAEVEYENATSPSIFVRFELTNPDLLIDGVSQIGKKVSFVIWTTTPWTLPANVALAIGKEFEYSALETHDEILIVAENLAKTFEAATQLQFIGESGTWTGEEILQLKLTTHHPFMKRLSPIVWGEHVTLESGTGVVHIAPGHGQEDYLVGQKNNLETLCPVDASGKLFGLNDVKFEEITNWNGLFIKKANPLIIDFLAAHGLLVNKPGETITHSYPHCWRCKNPVIFRATEQWFLSLSHNDLRKKALKEINCNVRWIPNWGHDRIYGMIENRPDWCLSRQRIWGVPIIVHHCTECQKPLLNEKIGEYICQIFEKEGADAWWKTSEPVLPAQTHCECGSTQFRKESSILDVWFDSGVSHRAVLDRRSDLSFPADLYLEGSDQHRGWFHSSLLTSVATRGHAPYKEVLTHGFVVDGEGRKYSKSAKNYVPPEKVLNSMGAELLRLWVGAEDYRNDIRVSDEIIKVLGEVYRKIRNTCRFMLGTVNDWSEDVAIPYNQRTELDRYILELMTEVVQKITQAYETFEFHTVHHTLNKFFTVDLSAFYLDILKDRLYCDAKNGLLRRSAQSTMIDILRTMIPLMAPILSFTAEEVWKYIPQFTNKTSSVFLSTPHRDTEWSTAHLKTRYERIRIIRDDVLKILELSRKEKIIGHPLDARVILSGDAELLNFLNHHKQDWTQIFIVSQVEIVSHLEDTPISGTSLKIKVEKARGEKCARCWNYSEEVGKHTTHPTLCDRCATAVEAL